MVAGEARSIGALDVVSGAERDQVLTAPDAAAEAAPDATVGELFARQVARDPDAVAIVSGDSAVSYRELDERSGRVAASLRRRGIGPEAVVAVALPRSADLAAVLLGVVKAGAAYLPIDPGLSAEQIRPRIGASVALLVGTAPAGSDPGLPATACDDLWADAAGDAGDGVPVAVRPDNAFSVTYGSGPADASAGVVVTHRNLVRYALDRHWLRAAPGTVLWHTSPASEALALELWVPLLTGGRVVVAAEPELDGDALAAVLSSSAISLAWLPAGLVAAVAAQRPGGLAGPAEIWTQADQVPAAALQRLRAACPELSIVNSHGPAGTTALVPAHRAAPDESADDVAAAGGLTDGTARYVLGPGLAPVPVGVTGDLYVAGSPVARGHAGRPGYTAQHFVPCPFGPAGGRMYRTGDRARWGDGGRLEYVGRAGAEARIRGVRVDTGRIEEVLSEHPRLAQSVVVVAEDGSGQQRLAAYVVPVPGRGADAGAHDPRTDLSHEELSRFVAGRVQESLLPSAFVVLERLPVTAAGRLDRTRLPEPEFHDGLYRAPRNQTEQVLAKLFADVLELGRVGIDEDFFDLGGNSLRAIRLVGLIRTELNLEVSIRTLFAARTIAGLSERRENLSRSSRPALRRRTKGGAVV